MKKILGAMRRCCEDFNMIAPGDRIAVGVSGGKDSMLLLTALAMYRDHMGIPFEVEAITLMTGIPVADYTPVAETCARLNVPCTLQPSDISEIVFNRRHEKNPCALCAKLRRGALNDIAVQRGCNKVALGHHRDDALETFLLSMFYEGRLHTFQPVTRLDRTGLTVIRPLLYISEKEIIGAARKLNLPIVQSTCPASGETKRQEMKEMLNAICRQIPTARQYMLNALKNTAQYGLWDKCGQDD